MIYAKEDMIASERKSLVPQRPRLNVYRSLSHVYAQIIDDTTGRTLVSASTLTNPSEISSSLLEM